MIIRIAAHVVFNLHCSRKNWMNLICSFFKLHDFALRSCENLIICIFFFMNKKNVGNVNEMKWKQFDCFANAAWNVRNHQIFHFNVCYLYEEIIHCAMRWNVCMQKIVLKLCEFYKYKRWCDQIRWIRNKIGETSGSHPKPATAFSNSTQCFV